MGKEKAAGWAADAAERRAAALDYAERHGVSVDEALEANAFREVTDAGRFAERVELPEPPPRPPAVSSDYLNEVVAQNVERLAQGLGRVDHYPGLDHPDFVPGAMELPPGLAREMPSGALEGTVTEVDPRSIHLDLPDQPVVWRDEPDWLDQRNALWRLEDRPAAVVLNGDGFAPRNIENMNVGSHVGGHVGHTGGDGYVSFGNSVESVAQRNQRMFGEHAEPIALPDGTYKRIQYLYEAYHPNGIHTDASYHDLGKQSGHREGEVLMPGGLGVEHIRRVWPRISHFDANGNLLESMFQDPIPNPRFKFGDQLRGVDS